MRTRQEFYLWLLALVLLVVALEVLPTSCHGFSFDDLNMSKEFSQLVNKTKDWVQKASIWVLSKVAGLRAYRSKDDLDTWPKFLKFYSFVKYSLKEPFTNRHPWVRCVRIGWVECTKRNGVYPVSLVWCPLVIYYECESSVGLPVPFQLMQSPIRRITQDHH